MEKRLMYKQGASRRTVALGDIVYMEKYGRKVVLYTFKEKHIFYNKFTEVLPQLDERFVYPHQSYIINMDYIMEIEGQAVVLQDKTAIILGRRALACVKKSFDTHMRKSLANKGIL